MLAKWVVSIYVLFIYFCLVYLLRPPETDWREYEMDDWPVWTLKSTRRCCLKLTPGKYGQADKAHHWFQRGGFRLSAASCSQAGKKSTSAGTAFCHSRCRACCNGADWRAWSAREWISDGGYLQLRDVVLWPPLSSCCDALRHAMINLAL